MYFVENTLLLAVAPGSNLGWCKHARGCFEPSSVSERARARIGEVPCKSTSYGNEPSARLTTTDVTILGGSNVDTGDNVSSSRPPMSVILFTTS